MELVTIITYVVIVLVLWRLRTLILKVIPYVIFILPIEILLTAIDQIFCAIIITTLKIVRFILKIAEQFLLGLDPIIDEIVTNVEMFKLAIEYIKDELKRYWKNDQTAEVTTELMKLNLYGSENKLVDLKTLRSPSHKEYKERLYPQHRSILESSVHDQEHLNPDIISHYPYGDALEGVEDKKHDLVLWLSSLTPVDITKADEYRMLGSEFADEWRHRMEIENELEIKDNSGIYLTAALTGIIGIKRKKIDRKQLQELLIATLFRYNRETTMFRYQVLFSYIRQRSMLTIIEDHVTEPKVFKRTHDFYLYDQFLPLATTGISDISAEYKEPRYFRYTKRQRKEMKKANYSWLGNDSHKLNGWKISGNNITGLEEPLTLLYLIKEDKKRPFHWMDYMYELLGSKQYRNFYLVFDTIEAINYTIYSFTEEIKEDVEQFIKDKKKIIIEDMTNIIKIVKDTWLSKIESVNETIEEIVEIYNAISILNILHHYENVKKNLKEYYIPMQILKIRYKIQKFKWRIQKVLYTIGTWIVYINYSVVFMGWLISKLFKR